MTRTMPGPITSSTVVRRRSDSPAADVAGEIVLANLQRGEYYGLDAVGSAIWRLMEHPVAVGTLCAALAEEYAAASGVIERDVCALLSELAARDLIETVR